MIIAIIVRRLDRASGVERLALSLGRELRSFGHHVTYYSFFYDKEKLFAEFGDIGEVVALNPKNTAVEIALQKIPFISSLVRAWVDTNRAKKLALLIDPKTDVLNPHDQVVYRVATYFKRHVRNAPSVWVMDDMPTRGFAQMRREACGDRPAGFVRKAVNAFVDWTEHVRFIRFQDRIAVLDNRDRDWVKEYFRKDALVIRNGTNAETFSYKLRTEVGRPAHLLMTGIFFPHRRFEDAIRALSILKTRGVEARISIVGQYAKADPYVQEIQNLIQELGVENNVELLGRVSDERLSSLYKEADIFLFPNHLQSWGLAVFEALASGLPAIVSTSAGASEVLSDRETALLVPPKEPGRLAEAVVTLLNDPVLYKGLSEKGRHFAVHELTWNKMARQIEGLFLEVCKK